MNCPRIASFLHWLALWFEPELRAKVRALETELAQLQAEQADLERRQREASWS